MLGRKLFIIIFHIILISLTNSQIEYVTYGAVTDRSFRIKTKSISINTISVQVNQQQTISYTSDADGYFDITINNLTPNTENSFDFIINGTPQNLNKKIKTMPATNSTIPLETNITFVTSSFSTTSTTTNAWNKIKSINPNFFMMLGNIYDSSITTSDWKNYETAFLEGIYFYFLLKNN